MPEATEQTKAKQDAPIPPAEEAECPQCAGAMRLWAGFYRCPNCGYKESCCF